jgi:hypothetical protein
VRPFSERLHYSELATGETGPRGQVTGGVGFGAAKYHFEGVLLEEFVVVGVGRPRDGEEDLRCVSVKDIDDVDVFRRVAEGGVASLEAEDVVGVLEGDDRELTPVIALKSTT